MENGEKITIVNLDRALRSAHSIFLQFDKDKNGTLETKELFDLLQACNISINQNECDECILQMDRDGDGAWNFSEFMTFIGMIYEHKLMKSSSAKKKNAKTKPVPPPRKDSLTPTGANVNLPENV